MGAMSRSTQKSSERAPISPLNSLKAEWVKTYLQAEASTATTAAITPYAEIFVTDPSDAKTAPRTTRETVR
jgi:hypothetical protein